MIQGVMNGNGYVSRISNWAHQPFTSKMSIWGWILFTILIASVAVLWVKGPMKHILAL